MEMLTEACDQYITTANMADQLTEKELSTYLKAATHSTKQTLRDEIQLINYTAPEDRPTILMLLCVQPEALESYHQLLNNLSASNVNLIIVNGKTAR